MASKEEEAEHTSKLSSQMESEMGTMFILDLMRQKREKLMRLKKDELINEMARKQREKMQQARDGHLVCDGTGFRGVQQIIDSADKSKTWKGSTKNKQ